MQRTPAEQGSYTTNGEIAGNATEGSTSDGVAMSGHQVYSHERLPWRDPQCGSLALRVNVGSEGVWEHFDASTHLLSKRYCRSSKFHLEVKEEGCLGMSPPRGS